jgi:hypothetical protein
VRSGRLACRDERVEIEGKGGAARLAGGDGVVEGGVGVRLEQQVREGVLARLREPLDCLDDFCELRGHRGSIAGCGVGSIVDDADLMYLFRLAGPSRSTIAFNARR